MTWPLLFALCLGLLLAVLVIHRRRREIDHMATLVDEFGRSRRRGGHHARLQHPHVNLAQCIGCGSCVRACPQGNVLELIHGQALVLNGDLCVGHGVCAEVCPTSAVKVGLLDLEHRRDIPALTESFEAVGVPGLFLAGELTGYALIRTAILHGTAVAAKVAANLERAGTVGDGGMQPGAGRDADLVVVGAGPAGFACALEAKRLGISCVVLEQEEIGGTIAKFPRRKLVLTEPVDLPLHGPLDKSQYTKEELVEIWRNIATEHELDIHSNTRFQGLERREDGELLVTTNRGVFRTGNVCLALGRRGTPKKLHLPGEERAHVAYGLLDAHSYTDRHILVVGGGDSAVEAALGLSEQPSNQVRLAYRGAEFFRIKGRNGVGLHEAEQTGRIEVMRHTSVERIEKDAVHLLSGTNGRTERRVVPADDVFVMIGGQSPLDLLERIGVSFDPHDRLQEKTVAAPVRGLLGGLTVSLIATAAAVAWVLTYSDFYFLPQEHRSHAENWELLRASSGVGLGFGIAATVLTSVNLCYLLRRSARFVWGSLQAWLSVHVTTGICALVLTMLHSGMQTGNNVGGHACQLLIVLVVTGALGRYFYSFVPHSANGRELAHDEVKVQLSALSAEWDRTNRGFGERVRTEVAALVSSVHWRGSLPRRALALMRSQSDLRRCLARLAADGRKQGVDPLELDSLLNLARRAQRTALQAAYYEDLRGILSSWRFVHRWGALLLVLLVVAHVFFALRYGSLLG